jgi:asparagine synthase (glutamine-hydrolysing)
MKEYIPEYIMNQPKRGWASPASAWLRKEMKGVIYEVLSENYNPEMKNIFDFDKIKIMLDDHIEARKYNMNLLWALLTWQIWYKKFF